MRYDLVIRGGEVVTPGGVQRCAIGIKGEKIAALALEPLEGEEVIDAEGKLVLPGAIDAHVHLEMPVDGLRSADDFYTGTVAAAFGGVTTLLDFAMQAPGRPERECIAERRAQADPKVVIDYSLHANFTEQSQASLAEIPKIIASGLTSFKLLTAYKRRGLMVEAGFLYAVLREARAHGGLVALHAEDGYIIEYLTERLLAAGKTGWIYHYESRPNFVEAAAIAEAIELAKGLGAPLYIVHLSTREGLELIKQARRAGYPIFAETCPHYLEFTKEKYLDEAGPDYVMSPPLRTEADRAALWEGLAEGSIDVVASEHCPFTQGEKRAARTFAEVPSGVMGLETMLPYLFSEGVGKGRISLSRLVELVSLNPARLFGLEGKGQIALGKDADLVILDPELERPVRAAELHMNTDYNIYEGKVLRGWPVLTISRGKVIMRDGEFLGSPGRGRFIARRPLVLGRRG
jgi:dihydropyrimidinase